MMCGSQNEKDESERRRSQQQQMNNNSTLHPIGKKEERNVFFGVKGVELLTPFC
jgi:hypothetical protein